MGVWQDMSVWHLLVIVAASAKVVIFIARMGIEYQHPLGTYKSISIISYKNTIIFTQDSIH